MCLLYGTKGSPSHMITGSRGVVSHTMKLFCVDVSYSASQFVQLSRKQTSESMKTSFVVFALIMLLVATNGAQASGKPRLYVSSKRSDA